jgi:hypothetical protein
MARQFGSQAFASYEQDMSAIKRAYNLNDIQKKNAIAQANALKASTQLNGLIGLGKSVVGAGSQAAIFKQLSKTGTGVYAPAGDPAGTDSGKWDPLGVSKG